MIVCETRSGGLHSSREVTSAITAAVGSITEERMDRRLPRQDFARNPSAKRRLCNTVGERIGRILEGCAAYCCAVPAARSRAAATTNLARSSLASVLRALFGGAKSCALVNLFMICPRWSASGEPTTTKFCPDHGHLMACLTDMRKRSTRARWSWPLCWIAGGSVTGLSANRRLAHCRRRGCTLIAPTIAWTSADATSFLKLPH